MLAMASRLCTHDHLANSRVMLAITGANVIAINGKYVMTAETEKKQCVLLKNVLIRLLQMHKAKHAAKT